MQLSFTQLTIDYYPYHKAGLYNNFFKRRKSCFYLFIYLFIYLFSLFRAAPMAYGGFWTRGVIGAVATGLHHSNARSKLHL